MGPKSSIAPLVDGRQGLRGRNVWRRRLAPPVSHRPRNHRHREVPSPPPVGQPLGSDRYASAAALSFGPAGIIFLILSFVHLASPPFPPTPFVDADDTSHKRGAALGIHGVHGGHPRSPPPRGSCLPGALLPRCRRTTPSPETFAGSYPRVQRAGTAQTSSCALVP